MSAIFLAAKIEEHPRRVRDIINCFHHIRQVKEKKYVFKQNYVLSNQRDWNHDFFLVILLFFKSLIQQPFRTISPLDFTGSVYVKQKNDVIKSERRLLKVSIHIFTDISTVIFGQSPRIPT